MGMVRLQTLGELGLQGADGQEVRSLLVQPKRVALLTYLAVAKPRGFHRRDSLLALLWPDQDAFHARAALRQVIHSLRHSLGEQALLARGEDLALDPAHFTCDVWTFERAVLRGEHETAASIYAGEFLPGFFLSGAPEFEQWVETERRSLSQAYAAELEGLAKEATGRDPARAVSRWRQLAEHDPYSPRIALRLMQALEVAGDAPAAIRHAEQHAALLREELDAEPDPEVSALADRLRKRPAGARAEVAAWPQVAAESIETPPEQAGSSTVYGAPPAGRAAERSSRAGARRLALVGAGVVLVLACLGTYAAFFGSGAARHRETVSSVAVLPFTNLSRDPENEYFSDGITDELLNQLTRVRGLSVAARTSSFYFKGKNLPVQEIARRLEVDAVLEGSVQRAAGRIRLSAQLISGRTGYHLWSETYDREASDLFAVEDEISRAIASALRTRLAGAAPGRAHVPDSAAHDLNLRARFLSNRGSRTDLERAIELFQQAIERDSAYAEPYAGAAGQWVNLADAYLAPLDAYPKAEVLARRALALDESNVEAHANVAYARLFLRWDWAGAEQEVRRALELNPRAAISHEVHAQYLTRRGDLRQALAENQEAVRLAPYTAIYAHTLVMTWWLLGEADSAIAAYARLQKTEPGYVYAAAYVTGAYRAKGRYAEALALDQAAAAVTGVPAFGVVEDLVALGRRAEAEAALGRMVAEAGRRYVMPEQIALAQLALGRREEALDWLERGVDVHSAHAPSVAWYPQIRPLRSDPRYQRLLRRMGLDDVAH